MKSITSDYKNNIKLNGRQLDSIITYEEDGETIELGVEQLNSVTPNYTSSILKSAMKQLDLDSNVEIPIGTILTYQFGVKVGEGYEYINYGNYVVYKVEKQEDTRSYKITCYDKMLYSMKDYEDIGATYPMTIRDYINAICTHLGLTFKNAEDEFVNYNRVIPNELYLDANGNSLGYTFRDVFDELACVTASTICINENDDKLEVRYINETNDTIDEEYLKDINVKFGEKYGPVNSIVLSRGAESDNVYLSDEESIQENGLCEIKIKDNQIMNFNDRSDYLPEILAKLDGLEYYINDYSSTGITYYELCDSYNVSIDNNVYRCIMFNDEVNITQGLVENIHADMPEDSETDYTKADKTDRRINQTYLMVDKQNQQIQSVISNVTEQNNKISQINQTVDEINSKISDIADITISGESNYATFTIEGINESEPIQLKIRPIVENISYLYPTIGLLPSSNLFLKARKVIFENLTTSEVITYTLPDNLLYYNSNIYDEFILDYGNGDDTKICQIIKRCEYNSDGTISPLSEELIVNYPYPTINLTDGDYRLSLQGYEYGYLFARLMAKNIYTTQFATRVEVNSKISQTTQEINLEVSKKVGNDEIISKINQSAEQISINANKLNLNGYITANDLARSGSTIINGSNITTGYINADLITTGTLSANRISGGHLEIIGNYTEGNAFVDIISPDSTTSKPIGTSIWNNGLSCFDYSQNGVPVIRTENDNGFAELSGSVVNAYGFNNISLLERKKNITEFKNGLSIIEKANLYKYNYKGEDDEHKKHIGLVIGEGYNTPKEVISGEGIDTYSMVSVAWQSIKELNKKIEELERKIKELESEK